MTVETGLLEHMARRTALKVVDRLLANLDTPLRLQDLGWEPVEQVSEGPVVWRLSDGTELGYVPGATGRVYLVYRGIREEYQASPQELAAALETGLMPDPVVVEPTPPPPRLRLVEGGREA